MKEYFNIDTNLPYSTLKGLCSQNNIFYASSNNGNVDKSKDGINWISLNICYPLKSFDSSSNKVFAGRLHGLYASILLELFKKIMLEEY